MKNMKQNIVILMVTAVIGMFAVTAQAQTSGTPGKIAKFKSSTILGDSAITEDKFGNVGIGATLPTSKLTVQGVIEALGGFKFPDGTIQTTSAADALLTVAHDVTLSGNGTQASPLGVNVPLILSGSVSPASSTIEVTNTAYLGAAFVANGGSEGAGVRGHGGDTNTNFAGGTGVFASGGNNSGSGSGGMGLGAFGGTNISTGQGGVGLEAEGGFSQRSNGGIGIVAIGGKSRGAGKSGGIGIIARRGTGMDGATDGLAGKFEGDVQVSGTISAGVNQFKIDHPLDPENEYLYHVAIESPEMMNIYNGNVTTDENGGAVVTLPDYFEALNKDFRYQLTVIGTFAQAIVAHEIKGNRFVIKTNAPNVKVSWQVTGIRQDAFANKNRIAVEEAKPVVERGYYLHPEAFDQPVEKGIEWARDPELMQQLKQRRIEAEQIRKRK
jgi:hypothetical protein